MANGIAPGDSFEDWFGKQLQEAQAQWQQQQQQPPPQQQATQQPAAPQRQEWTRQNVSDTLKKYGAPTQANLQRAVAENPWLGQLEGNGKIRDIYGTGHTWDVIGNIADKSGATTHWQTLTGNTARAAAAAKPPPNIPMIPRPGIGTTVSSTSIGKPVGQNTGGGGYQTGIGQNTGGGGYQTPTGQNTGGGGYQTGVGQNTGGGGYQTPTGIGQNTGGGGYQTPVGQNTGGPPMLGGVMPPRPITYADTVPGGTPSLGAPTQQQTAVSSQNTVNLPPAPTLDRASAGTFNYPGMGQLGAFNGPAPYQSPAPFQSEQGVPTPRDINYNQMSSTGPVAPDLNYQTLSSTGQLGYNAMGTPSAYQGNRQVAPEAFGYQAYQQPDAFKAPTAEEAAADPGYQFGLKQSQGALQNNAASKGILQSKNFVTGMTDLTRQAAQQQYGDVYGRKFGEYNQTNANNFMANQANNSGQLGAYNTNTANALGVNSENYNRGATESQQGFSNAFNVNQANNAGQNAATQGNNANALAFGQANNQNAMAFGQQNIANAQTGFQNQFAVNQANNQGQAQATQANNASQLAAQGQGYGQAANTWGMNQAAGQGAQAQNFGQAAQGYQMNVGAQNQGYNQALGGFQTNTGNQLQVNNMNNQNALALYGAQSNSALGLGNLNLGYQQAGNQYALGQGQLGLGYQNSAQDYALGQGNLGLGYQNSNNQYALGQRGLDLGFQNSAQDYKLGQGQLTLGQQQAANALKLGLGGLSVQQQQLAMQQQGQNFNQNAATYGMNYQANVTDPWNQYYQLAQLGNPGAPNAQQYANAQGDLLTGQGNANAAGQVGAANAWTGALGNVANTAQQAAYLQWLQSQQRPPQVHGQG